MGDGASRAAMMTALKAQIALEEQEEKEAHGLADGHDDPIVPLGGNRLTSVAHLPTEAADDDEEAEEGDNAESDLATAPRMMWEMTYGALVQACGAGAGHRGGLVLSMSAWDENTIRADTLIGGAEVAVPVATCLSSSLALTPLKGAAGTGAGDDTAHTGGGGGAKMVHTEIVSLSEVVLKDAHSAQQNQPCGFMSVTLRIQVHCCSNISSGSVDTSNTTSSSSSSGSGITAVPQPTDKVVVQVLRIDAHDLKDVEMGFLGMKSEEDKNDVYVKLRLGGGAEVSTDVRDNAGPAASFDYEAGHDAHAAAVANGTASGGAAGAGPMSPGGGADKGDAPAAEVSQTPQTSSASAPYRVSAVARARWEKVRYNLSAMVKMGRDMRRAKYAVLGRVGAEEFVGHREVEKRTFYPYSLVALEGERVGVGDFLGDGVVMLGVAVSIVFGCDACCTDCCTSRLRVTLTFPPFCSSLHFLSTPFRATRMHLLHALRRGDPLHLQGVPRHRPRAAGRHCSLPGRPARPLPAPPLAHQERHLSPAAARGLREGEAQGGHEQERLHRLSHAQPRPRAAHGRQAAPIRTRGEGRRR